MNALILILSTYLYFPTYIPGNIHRAKLVNIFSASIAGTPKAPHVIHVQLT